MEPTQVSPGRWSYRNYTIHYDYPPEQPYSYWADDYDGAPIHSYGSPADHRHGNARTLEEAVQEIDDLIEEENT